MRYQALSRLVPNPAEFVSAPPTHPTVWNMPPDELTPLLDLDAIDQILDNGLPSAFVRVVRAGRNIPPEEYTWGPRPMARKFAAHVRPGAVTELLAQGCTLVFDGINRYWKPLDDFARRLAHEAGLPTFTTGFLTPAGTTGFPYHHDEIGNLLIQTIGSKTWRVREPLYPAPLPFETARVDRPTAEQLRSIEQAPPALEVTLRPGDVLWIPRGWLHSGTATDEASVHATIGFAPLLTRYWLAQQLIEHLAARADEFPRLRQELPWGLARRPEQLRDLVSDFMEEFAHAVSRADARDLAERVTRTIRNHYPEPRRHPVGNALSPVGASAPVRLQATAVVHAARLPDGRLRIDTSDTTTLVKGAVADRIETELHRAAEGTWDATAIVAEETELPSTVATVRRLLELGILTRADD
jgi:hypothetical protein